MVSKAEATEKFYEGLGMALTEGMELSKVPGIEDIQKISEKLNTKESDPLNIFNSWSVTGQSQEMRARMQADTWVIKDMAIRGQYTAIYAPPNTGKTLLVLWGLIQQVNSDGIDGKDIYYVNADDHGKGAVDKVEICEQYGINMLIPNWNGFDTKQLRPMMRALIDGDRARGVVIVLDTLKKFTVDLMDKKSSSDFGNLAREFATAGGSPIVLAHTNKNKGRDGKSIAGGTSDIVDDADCAFVLDTLNPDSGSVHTIEARNTKNRGDVPQKVSYQFTRERGQSYWDLLNSVKRLDKDEAQTVQEKAEVKARLVRDADTIRVIQRHITQNNQFDVPRTKTELIKHIAKETKHGEHKVRSTMNYFEGDDYDAGYRWTCDKVGNERPVYKLLDPPLKR
jgi:hypothetical protein